MRQKTQVYGLTLYIIAIAYVCKGMRFWNISWMSSSYCYIILIDDFTQLKYMRPIIEISKHVLSCMTGKHTLAY